MFNYNTRKLQVGECVVLTAAAALIVYVDFRYYLIMLVM